MRPPPRHAHSGRVMRDPRLVATRWLVAAVGLGCVSGAVGIAQAAAPDGRVASVDSPPPSRAAMTSISGWARPVLPTVGAEGAWDPDATAERPESPVTVTRSTPHPVTPASTVQAAQQPHTPFAGASATGSATTTTATTTRTTPETTAATTTEAAASTTATVTTSETVDPEPTVTTSPTPTVIEEVIDMIEEIP